MKILILGASGMLGHILFRTLSRESFFTVSGTIRSQSKRSLFEPALAARLINCAEIRDVSFLKSIFQELKPNVVVNCISLGVGQLKKMFPLDYISTYSLLPHQLLQLCKDHETRLVHISTDGVFSGQRGGYSENDIADASDLYGLSKRLGEINSPNAITIRTSIIGPDLTMESGLLSWFLRQEGHCEGYTRALFSGLPTVVLAEIIRDIILPNFGIAGTYHIAAEPISKFNLLREIALAYEKSIEIIPVDQPVINRSLNAEHFYNATGYRAPEWSTLIATMKLRS